MNYFIRHFCICLVFLFPFTIHAKFTGEFIFFYPGKNLPELWITHFGNVKNTRLLYRHTEDENIWDISFQKDGSLIAISAGHLASDIYLIDRNRLRDGARNLTENRFNATGRVDISPNGDILFTNTDIFAFPDVPVGLYFITHDEVKKVKPQATLLKEGQIDFVRWSPDGDQFYYYSQEGFFLEKGLFLYNLLTAEESLITKDRMSPAFSPDGKRLAFIFQPTLNLSVEIDVISLESMYPQLFPHDPEDNLRFHSLKWPSKNYLAYTLYDRKKKHTKHFVIRINDGHPKQILEEMEDMFENGLQGFYLGNATYSVEPSNRLTTVWGKIKILNKK